MRLISVFVLGLVVGVLAALIAGRFWIYPQVAREKFQFGIMHGEINAQSEIARKVDALLGKDFDRKELVEPFYSVKDTSVMVVTRNGVKTLRTCCNQTGELTR